MTYNYELHITYIMTYKFLKILTGIRKLDIG